MKHSVLILTLCATGGLASMPTAADPRDRDWPGFEFDEVSKVVRFRDLDPAQPAEARELLKRIDSASHRVCLRDQEIRNLQAQRDRDACARESYVSAVADINRRHKVDLEAVAAIASEATAVANLAE